MADRFSLTTLQTTAEVMEVLGGPSRVRELIQRRAAYNTVWQWGQDDTFPARYFLEMWIALLALGYDASPRLWDQGELPREKEVLLKTFVRRKLRSQAQAA